MPLRKFRTLFLFVALFVFFNLLFGDSVFASTIDDLNKKIKERSAQIKQVQEEIARLNKEIENTAKETVSLKSQIKNLEAVGKKLSADIKLTQNQIQSAKLNIEKLNLEIGEKNEGIADKKISLGEFIRSINEAESANALEMLLTEDDFSDFFSNIDRMNIFQAEIKSNLNSLENAKNDLEDKKKDRENYKKNMEKLNSQYADQKELVDINKNKTNKVLNDTKNKETNFKQQLVDKIAKQKSFEQEIEEFEEQIKLEIDKTALPKTGSGVLKWPLDFVKITQYFGNTAFATANPVIYNGGGHNAIDLRATIGTRILSAKEGVVTGIGDTDKACSGVSYGKWVLIKHPNNLSTLYAHLDIIKVSVGQQVETGQVVGYSGDTGYATGPHLHFAVFASEGVAIQSYKSKICGTNMVMPVKIKNNAYLNPLSYL